MTVPSPGPSAAGPLWLGGWCASRRVGPTAASVVLVVLAAVFAATRSPAVQISFRPDAPRLLLHLGSLAAAVIGCAATLALQPPAPEWEARRLPRTRLMHAVTWAVLALAVPLLPALALAVHLRPHVPYPWAVLTLPLLAIGLHAALVALLGVGFGTVLGVAAVVAMVLVEQFSGARWPVGDDISPPSFLIPVAAALAGLAAQAWSAGHPFRPGLHA